MFKNIAIAILAVVGICASVWLVAPRSALAESDMSNLGLQQFAGTYWIVYSTPAGPLPALATLHPDGTYVSVDGSDEGLGGIFTVNSAALGAYDRIGPRATRIRMIWLSYDQNGFPVSAYTATGDADWDDVGLTGALQLREYDLTIGENPLDPNQGTLSGDPLAFQGWKLNP